MSTTYCSGRDWHNLYNTPPEARQCAMNNLLPVAYPPRQAFQRAQKNPLHRCSLTPSAPLVPWNCKPSDSPLRLRCPVGPLPPASDQQRHMFSAPWANRTPREMGH